MNRTQIKLKKNFTYVFTFSILYRTYIVLPGVPMVFTMTRVIVSKYLNVLRCGISSILFLRGKSQYIYIVTPASVSIHTPFLHLREPRGEERSTKVSHWVPEDDSFTTSPSMTHKFWFANVRFEWNFKVFKNVFEHNNVEVTELKELVQEQPFNRFSRPG